MVFRTIAYCLLSALVMLLAAAGAGHPAWWYAAGVVFAASFLPFLFYGAIVGIRRLIAVWWALLTVTVICLWSEAVIFVHETREARIKNLVGALVLYALLAAAIGVTASLLRLQMQTGIRVERSPETRRRAVRVLGSGLAYAIYYYVFGAIAFFLFTKPYYSGSTGALAGAQESARALGWWLPLIQIGRGVLITLGVLPIILSLRMKRVTAAVYVGSLLWVIGGLAPLIPPNGIMPGELRLMHIIEIFTQNFPLGVTAVLLLYPRQRQESAPVLVEAVR